MAARRRHAANDERPHFLIDTSALVPFFYPTDGDGRKARAAILKLLKMRGKRRVLLHIPIVCMAECSKVFAKIAYQNHRAHQEAKEEYRTKIQLLLDAVSSRRQGLIQSLGVTRKHLEDIEEIFTAQYALKPHANNQQLSGLDGIIISMGKHLARHYRHARVFLVTGDRWMATVCEKIGSPLPNAIYVYEEEIPDY